MITNERQFKITKSQLALLQQAVANFNIEEKTNQIGSKELAAAELEALISEATILQAQINEYEYLRSGVKISLSTSSLDELPRILIQARIAQNLSQKELASLLDLKEQQIQRYESEEYQSASLKRLVEVADALKLNISGIAEINKIPKPPSTGSKDTFDWSKFPFKEMYKRGWFEGFSDSFEIANQGREELLLDFFNKASVKPALGLHRKHIRANSILDEYALLAWECRVLQKARGIPICTYWEEKITPEWISKLVKLSKFQDGPRKAKEMIEQAGIILVVEPMLPNTYLDGAAILLGENPIIGLTLRYDRLDNFWFVLLHEIYHVIKHLGKKRIDRIFDDLDALNTEKLEHEADELAGEALIPSSEWKMAVAKFSRSERSVKELAINLEICPAIIAGRIRHEANNYIILTELIGQGEVRKHFPEVIFDN